MQKSQSTIIPGAVGKIEVRLSESKTGDKWVVISHPHPQFGGTMDNKVVTTLERAFQSLGYGTLVYQFRGVGLSEGAYDGGQGEQQDLEAVVNWLRQSYAVEHLVLAGFSFGSYISLKQAKALAADQLLVVAPPVNLYDFSGVALEGIPWVLVQGGKDEIVPAEEVLDWVRGLDGLPDIHWRNEASHFFHRQLVWLKQVVLLAF